MKVLSCSDMGSECSFEARAETEEELKKLVAEHGKAVHNMEGIPDELWEKAKAVIREE